MQREPEPELMDDRLQAEASAAADFADPHDRFVALFRERHPDRQPRRVLDLGCGPADPTRRFARAFPGCRVTAIDASAPMIELAEEANRAAALEERITLLCGRIPDPRLRPKHYDTVLSNSLLHHLADPTVLWQALCRHTDPAGTVFVMDLLRPEDTATLQRIVERYAGDAPPVLRRDFARSLRAAYRPDEVTVQLERAGLPQLRVEVVSDRHLIVHGPVDARRRAR